MPLEIERKFLVVDETWREQADDGTAFRQGYLIGSEQASVRVRIEGETAKLNIKSATLGIRRQEYEYAIPLSEATEILDTLCQTPLIEKTRYHVNHEGFVWEVDVFGGDNTGLVVAEVELPDESTPLPLPEWVGQEVSGEKRYYNVCLVEHPFCNWSEEERAAH